MSAALSLNGSIIRNKSATSPAPAAGAALSRRGSHRAVQQWRWRRRWGETLLLHCRCGGARSLTPPAAGSRSDDSSTPFEMSVEGALKLLGVSDGASFDDILRAKKAIVASCKDDLEAVARVEAAYDMLLMQSLTQRRAGKDVSSSIRYADVKSVRSSETGSLPQWLQKTVKNAPVSIEVPSSRSLGIQAGVYGALMVFTYVSGSSASSTGVYNGPDVPGIILATGFGASLYFLTKKSISLGKATIITAGGLVAGAVVGSVVEKWLQVDIVPLFGVHSPEVIVAANFCSSTTFKSLPRMKEFINSLKINDMSLLRDCGLMARRHMSKGS